jgi:serine/threonine kinase PknH
MFNCIRAATASAIAAGTILGFAATSAAQPADNQANNAKLFGMLSGGYAPANCVASKLYDAAIARLGCGATGQPGGPNGAIYSLYANATDMNTAFNGLTHSGDMVACPGSAVLAATAWPGGMVACTTARGPSEGAPMVAWTRTADFLVVSARGQDLATLYNWWLGAR